MYFPFLRSLLFIFSVVTTGFLLDRVIIALIPRNEYSPGMGMFSAGKIPLYFALGAVIYSFFATVLSIGGIKLSLTLFCTLVTMLLLLNIFLCKDLAWFKRGAKPNLLVSGIILAGILLIVWEAATKVAMPTFGIDLFGHLWIKAKILLNSTFRDSLFFHDPLFAHMHVKYPPMFAVFYNLLFLFTGGAFNGYYHVVNCFVLFCVGYAIYAFLSETLPKWQAALWFFIFISAGYYTRMSLMDGSDTFLSLFFFLSVVSLYRFIKNGRGYDLAICALTAAGGALLKNEGTVFAVFIVLILALNRRSDLSIGRESVRKTGFFIAVFLALLLPWYIYRSTLSNAGYSHLGTVAKTGLGDHLANLFLSINVFSRQIFNRCWSGVFAIWVIASAVLFRHYLRSKVFIFSLIIFAQLSVCFSIFWLTCGNIIQHSFSTTGILRVISHCYPLALSVAALGIGRILLSGYPGEDTR